MESCPRGTPQGHCPPQGSVAPYDPRRAAELALKAAQGFQTFELIISKIERECKPHYRIAGITGQWKLARGTRVLPGQVDLGGLTSIWLKRYRPQRIQRSGEEPDCP